MPRQRGTSLQLALVVLCGAGCGDSKPQLVPVTGRVVHRGQPVGGASVQFLPDAAAGTVGPPALGSTGSDGSFSLQSPPHGAGALAGKHKVTVGLYSGREGLPPKYADPTTTPLRVDVPPEGLADRTIRLDD